jgi:hypothetical protein
MANNLPFTYLVYNIPKATKVYVYIRPTHGIITSKGTLAYGSG